VLEQSSVGAPGSGEYGTLGEFKKHRFAPGELIRDAASSFGAVRSLLEIILQATAEAVVSIFMGHA
jgi:hypothetical protein